MSREGEIKENSIEERRRVEKDEGEIREKGIEEREREIRKR